MKQLLMVGLTVSLAMSGSVLADHDNDNQNNPRFTHSNSYHQGYSSQNVIYDRAKVVRVEPVIKRYQDRYRQQSYSSERCYVEEPRYTSREHKDKGSVIGGIIGAVIGHKIGSDVSDKRSSKHIGAVAGAVIGSKIGQDVAKNKHRDYQEYCETSNHNDDRYHDTRYRNERIIGYNVTYKYKGKKYHTFMDYKPGRWIDVEVEVRPRGQGYRS